jgi:hypothetical protein
MHVRSRLGPRPGDLVGRPALIDGNIAVEYGVWLGPDFLKGDDDLPAHNVMTPGGTIIVTYAPELWSVYANVFA